MSWIKNLLSKYQALTPPEAYIKTCISKAIEEVTGISIDDKAIVLKGNTIFVKERHGVKATIFMERGRILKIANSELKERQFSDIR
ncbi:MAG: hypothetical protein HY455_00400 [Parcubacteria group bacterium]|nr:hypothetical protein [Parcubacteria group bacterium]